MLYSISPPRNKSHEINGYRTFFFASNCMSKSTRFVCTATTFNHIGAHNEIESYQLVSNDMWLSPGVIALSLNKTIDWSNFKILAM